jgi:cytochrome P450
MSTVNPMSIMERLSIGKEHFRAIGLLPLAYVAWADGSVQMTERSAILHFAKTKGWLDSGEEALLTEWLTTRPGAEDALDAARAVAALARDSRALASSVPLRTPSDILLACHEVCGASGGLFGLRNAISAEEAVALQKVADALEIDPGADWRALVETLENEESAAESEPRFAMGDLKEMLNDPFALFLRKWQRFGDVARMRMGPIVAHLVVHPDHAQHVLVDNNRNYMRDPTFEELGRAIGNGIMTSDGELWRRQRRIMQPAFHQKKIAAMHSTMVQECRGVVDMLLAAAESGRAVDINRELNAMALRIASKALFSTESAEEAASLMPAMAAVYTHVTTRTQSIVKIPEAVPTAANRRFREAMEVLNGKVYRTIERRRNTDERFDDLMSMLLEARDEETGKGMTDQELRNEVLILLLAGTDTNSTGLTWTWWYLSKLPHVLRELQAEVDQVLGGREPSVEDLPKLVSSWAILQESMRLMPPAWVMMRKAVAEDSLAGRRIPKGSLVYISTFLIHRHPAFWENPEAFDPSRFSPENEKRQHPCAFLPFGAGPRKCIGVAFAQMTMKIALSMIAQKVELHLVPGFEPERDPSFLLRPKAGLWMTVHPRKKS